VSLTVRELINSGGCLPEDELRAALNLSDNKAIARFPEDNLIEEGGVSCELVSEMPNSLLAGKIQGISSIFG